MLTCKSTAMLPVALGSFGNKIVAKSRIVGVALAITAALGGEARAGGVTTEFLGAGDPGSSISADGNLVAFTSLAVLIPGGTLDRRDAYLRNRQAGVTQRVSVGPCNGLFCSKSNGFSETPQISAGGRFVVFSANASNLVRGDTNGRDDVFLRDRRTNTTERVSMGASGVQGNDHSRNPSISADGRFVAFKSLASNLVPGDTNGAWDIFIRDRQLGTTSLASVRCVGGGFCTVGNTWSQLATISADGRFVVFSSGASNLVSGDTNGIGDAFVFERATLKITRVSLGTLGSQANGITYSSGISSDGRYVVFTSKASNLVLSDTNGADDAFVYDRQNNITTRVSVNTKEVQGNHDSGAPSISADGRFVAFESKAPPTLSQVIRTIASIFSYVIECWVQRCARV